MKNKHYSKIVVLFILALVLNIQDIQAVEQVDLKLILRPGQKYEMRMKSKVKSSETSQGQVSKSVQVEIVQVVFHVQDVNSQGDILMKVTFGKLKTKRKSPTNTFEFDSTKPDAGPKSGPAPIYSALIGQDFKIKVASNGNILELIAIDDMILKMAEKMAKKATKKYGTREKTKKLIEMFYSEEKIRTMMRAFIQILPSGPVTQGDSWEEGVDIEELQGCEINLESTLKNYEKDNVIIDSVYKTSLDDRPIKHKSMPNMIFTKIDYRGTAQIDKSSGWIIHKKVNTSFSIEMKHQGIISISGNIIKIIELVEHETS